MPVQTTLNLPARKTRLRSKLAAIELDNDQISRNDIKECCVLIEDVLEKPRRRGRPKKENKPDIGVPARSPVKRSSPTKLPELCSPSKRAVTPPKERIGHAVRSLFSSPRKNIDSPTKTLELPRKTAVTPIKIKISQDLVLRCSPRKLLREKNAENDARNERPVRTASPLKYRSPMKGQRANLENVPTNGSPVKNRSPKKSVQVTKADSSLYMKARHSLHTQLTDSIVGRDEEIAKLSSIIEPALKKSSSTSLYVSGAPGTGKTVSLTHILDTFSKNYKFQTIFINCMTVKNAATIYSKICEGLSFKGTGLEGVQEGVRKKSCVIVLDEVDQLQSHNQQILYSLFELPKLKDSKVVLIGIANALDLTDKTVPLLQAYGYRPHLYNFTPYSDKQIVSILKSRLSECGTVIKPMALTFLAKKIATCTGDVRKALDICRRAVEIVERQVRQQRILASRTDPTAVSSPVIVDIGHISQVMSDVFNTRARGNQDLHTTLPLQQKLLLCALLVIIKRKSLKEITMGKLHEVYGRVCKLSKVSAIDYSEVLSICTLLESRALVSIKKAKENRQSKVRLAVDEAEVEQVLQDQTILALCMAETSIC